ncbi:hypothetical protein GCM10009554_50770 [Kribbella koreensis]|uniref:LysR substrate-binding domain-containing protein n=1 Tax=Kribbella koreensis TaxID=57909 RepID=A0ABP4BJ88_9ACTN
MVGSRTAIQVEGVDDPRWAVALELLVSGEAAIGLSGLRLSSDPPTPAAGRRLQIEFPCPVDPVRGHAPPSSYLAELARSSLERARALIANASAGDSPFRMLVAESDLLYEFVYDYGTGTLLLATARPTGPLDWR